MNIDKQMDAFLETLLPMQPAMQLVAERLLHSAVDAEDTVQEVVIELWEKRNKLSHVRSLEAYAIQAVKNRCISLLRKRQDLVTDDIDTLGDLSDAAVTTEVALMEEQAAMLDKMIERLPEKQRQAVQMKYIDMMSHEEMQKRLGMSSTNVYATLSRALSALKEMVRK